MVVIGAAGMGLMNLMRGNSTSTAQADRRAEVNRALEFISDEVRRAETIELDVSSIPSGNLPPSFDASKEKIVLALNVPDNLGQDTSKPNQKVIYYVKPKPNNDKTWLGPNIIYRYGPPLDTTGGSYTSGTWVDQALIDRVNDQTITPNCRSSETAIPAKGFAACVDSGQKIAKIYVNGKFSGSSSDDYNADMQVYARAEKENLESKPSKINFGITKSSGNSTVRIIASQMGCSRNITDYNSGGGKCTITTEFKKPDDTLIATVNSGSSPVNVGTNNPFKIKVIPSTIGLGSNAFTSYFDASGNAQTGGSQNNNKAIEVKIDLSKDYLNENPVTVLDTSNFLPEQVKLLGDKSQFSDLDSWNLDDGTNSTNFDKLKTILEKEGFLDKDGEITLKSNEYLIVFEVGQNNIAHKGFDLQDHIVLITVE